MVNYNLFELLERENWYTTNFKDFDYYNFYFES